MIYEKDNLVTPPNSNSYGGDMWLDESIWGHRIFDSQSPWLIFLEFINVAEAKFRDGYLFDEQDFYYPLTYNVYRRMHLRNILFNNIKMEHLSKENRDSADAWSEWLMDMAANGSGINPSDFSYLKKRFSSFENFASLVRIIRGSVVEAKTNKRWTSRFIFPFGPNAIYDDVAVSNAGKITTDRVNFGRTGELLYLMLARSSSANALREKFITFFKGNHQLNEVLKLFQPEESNQTFPKGINSSCYLPYKKHPSFDLMGEDMLNIFNLGLPGFDAYQHLVLLGAFHISLYQLKVAGDLLNQPKQTFICEVIAPRKNLVRELAMISYQKNKDLTLQAVRATILKTTESSDWIKAIESYDGADAFHVCCEHLRRTFSWPNEYNNGTNPKDLLKTFISEAEDRHRKYAGNVHSNYGRLVGLISKRATNRMRYAPSDHLIKALILANVPKRLELKEFLSRLFNRYGLVFGSDEAVKALDKDEIDIKSFQSNALRFEQRLSSMGLLRRLSDACAYVENPFSRSNS